MVRGGWRIKEREFGDPFSLSVLHASLSSMKLKHPESCHGLIFVDCEGDERKKKEGRRKVF